MKLNIVPLTLKTILFTRILFLSHQMLIVVKCHFFWEEQQKYLSSSKTGVRYHPQIIRYCLGLAAKSPSFYDDIRCDENNNTGFLMLPSRRHLRDYKN